MIKVQLVTRSWNDIRRKIEKMEDWQEKSLIELLKEAQRVYLRREEEKQKAKAKIIVAVARESREGTGKSSEEEIPKKESRSRDVGKEWSIKGRKCYYCGEEGHFRSSCEKWRKDERVFREAQVQQMEA